MADGTDLFTLAEGLTLTVSELSPYGGTLTETGSKHDTDAITLADTGVVVASDGTVTASDTGTLDDTGVVVAGDGTLTASDSATLSEDGVTFSPTPLGSDTGTLAEGITLTVSALSPYGATLAEAAGFAKTGTDTGTLAETGVLLGLTSPTDTDTGTLSESTSLAETVPPSDAIAFSDDLTTTTVDDLVAEGTLTDTASLTALGRGTDTGTLSESTQLSTSVGTVTSDDEDTLTLAEAVVLTVLSVGIADSGTLAEGSALLLTSTDTLTISEATALTILATGTDTGTLTDTGSATISYPGGAIVVTVTSTDTATLSDTGIALGPFNGKALGTVGIAVRATAVARVIVSATVTEADFDPLAVGAGDL